MIKKKKVVYSLNFSDSQRFRMPENQRKYVEVGKENKTDTFHRP